MLSQSLPMNPAFSQSQSQVQIGTGFQGQFQLSQAQVTAQAQLKAQQAHVQAQAQAAHAAQVQAAHAQFQAQLQAQAISLSQAQNAALGNLGSSSPSFSTPGSMNLKRLPQKPPVRPPGVPMPSMISPLRTMDLTPAARRKKQKLPEKQLQDRVAAISLSLLCIHSFLNLSLELMLLYLEKRSEQFRRSQMLSPQLGLKIVGRILEDGIDPDQPGVVQKSNPCIQSSHIFSRE
ncbi:hypothetical protein GH714_008041 [Hevea brasiliensis]|uniref:Uncharacterized protein n=1 Tax=Hevea brasiliensis TaxID=3981 RepID=A0A6A6M064_HEVBR|nr:hypothetical protein GH714_008041 [Hevea brasiliensis]